MTNAYEVYFHYRNKPSSIEFFADNDDDAIMWLEKMSEAITQKRFTLLKQTTTDITPD